MLVLFVGSFDPFTIGHRHVVERALTLFDEVVVGIGVNPDKHYLFGVDERKKMIQDIFRHEKRVRVETYEGMTVDFASEIGARCIIKGVRNAEDFEYEYRQAQYNRQQTGIETLLLCADKDFEHVSSTAVRAEIRG